jgi:phosphoenolpyruvate synthase/pyruvate phosphate dikinase
MNVMNLGEINKHSILIAGGKGANLGEMLKNGFPVPKGFCVTSSAYDRFIQDNGFANAIEIMLAEINRNPSQGAQLSKRLREDMVKGELSKELYQQIKQAYESMGADVRVAVRSSATAEDLPKASFAGQQETFLNIKGTEEVINAIKKCFASLWTERAISYRRENGFDEEENALAVVIQEMVEGDISGVLFTVNPVNNQSSEMVINGTYGLGESVVSGSVTPDTFIWDRNEHKIKEKLIGEKKVAVIYNTSGGTVTQINPEAKASTFSLKDDQVKRLADLGEKIEAHYHYPQDIEWTIKEDKLFILQARNITTLKESASDVNYADLKDKKVRMVMNNLIEHCPSPIYPLDYDPFLEVLRGKSSTMEEIGMKITQDKAIVLKENGEFEIHSATLKFTPKILLIPFKIKDYQNFNKNNSETQKVMKSIPLLLDKIEENVHNKQTVSELLNEIQEIMKMVERIIYVRFRYNIYPSFIAGKIINKKLKKMNPSISQYEIYSDLHYKTWDMNLEISGLAAFVNEVKPLREEIIKLGEGKECSKNLEEIALLYPEFGNRFHRILKNYGWKSTSTYYAFSASSWNEDKKNFVTLLCIAMEQKASIRKNNRFNEITSQLKSVMPEKKAEKLIQVMNQMRAYHQTREESLYLLERCYGICRLAAKMVAEKKADIFDDFSEIYYLRLNELYAIENTSAIELKSKVRLRRKAVVQNQRLWDFIEVQKTEKNTHQLKGISGNSGQARGKVCIIHSVDEFDKLKKGDILVCKYTDPIWTPLFTIAKGVVSDTGGPLSHSAIVAREYNIPAVLGCGNATRSLADGQEIIVDGDHGTVHFIS